MAINASAGAKIYVGPINNTADDATAYEALSGWIEIGEVETLGEYGDQAQQITFASLNDARLRKLKGVKDAGDISLTVANDPLDEGQQKLVEAEGTSFSYAFKVVIPDAADSNDTDSTDYFRAKVGSKRKNVGGANDVTKRTFVLQIDSKIVEVPSEAVSGGT